MKRFGQVVCALAASALLLTSQWTMATAWEPKDQGECIAPANPGGGWDNICRYTSSVLQKTGLVKPNIYVTNMPGGSGAVAIANVVAKRGGDPNLLVAASTSLTFTIAMKRTPHTYKDVVPIGQIGVERGGFFVNADSKFKTIDDLIKALKADPKSVTFCGGSAPGSLDHIKAAIFAKEIGVDPTKLSYVPFQGGGEALTAIMGGHADVAALDVSEAVGQLEAGKIRGLVLLSSERSAKFKDIPTTYDSGIKVDLPNWRGLYMAPGAPPEAVAFWTETIKKMVLTPEFKEESQKLGWEPAFKFGEEFATFVNAEDERFQVLLKELGFLK